MPTSFCSHGLQAFWLGRDTLSDEHLLGTAAGVMSSWAVRRLQEPGCQCSSHRGNHICIIWADFVCQDQLTRSLLRPELCQYRDSNSHHTTKTEAREVRDGAGRCRAVNNTSAPGGDSQGISAWLLLHLVLPQSHRCKFLSHRFRNLYVKCHPPSEKTASQKPADVNTVLTRAGVYNGNEMATWTEDQEAPHTAKRKELLNMEVV